jgi:hypothetical protein
MVTTLEVKNELRRLYPNSEWKQIQVSSFMKDLFDDDRVSFADNGNYRVYSLSGCPAGQPLTRRFLLKEKKTPVVSNVSKTRALEIIKSTNNHFFGVTFVTKELETRKLVCRVPGDVDTDHLGYLRVLDAKEGGIKTVNMQTLSEVRVNGNIYRVN